MIRFITRDSNPFRTDTERIIAMHPIAKPIMAIQPLRRLGPAPFPPSMNRRAIKIAKFIRTLMRLLVQCAQPGPLAKSLQKLHKLLRL